MQGLDILVTVTAIDVTSGEVTSIIAGDEEVADRVLQAIARRRKSLETEAREALRAGARRRTWRQIALTYLFLGVSIWLMARIFA